MHEPNASSDARPHFSRNTSYHGLARNTYRISPLRSPVSAVSSLQSGGRINEGKTPTVNGALYSPEPGEVIDPRLKILRSVSVPDPRLAMMNKEQRNIHPASPNMNMDGSPDEPEASRSDLPSALPDVVMADAAPSDEKPETALIQALLRFIAPAVSSGIHQQRLNQRNEEVKEAKDEREKSKKQTKLPPVIMEERKLKHDQAVKGYKAVSKDLHDVQAIRDSTATELVKQIAALVSTTSTHHHEAMFAKETEETRNWQTQVTARVESFNNELASLRTSNLSSEKLEALEMKQIELELLIKKAQPQFEQNIDFLKVDLSRLRTDNSSLRADVRTLKDELRDLKEITKDQFKQHVLISEFDAYKTVSASNETSKEEASVQQSKNEAEMKSLCAKLVSLEQTMENKLSLHVLQSEFDQFKTESSRLPVPTTPNTQGTTDDMLTDDAEARGELQSVHGEIEVINGKINGFAAMGQSALEAINRSEQLQQQIDQHHKDLTDLKSKMSTVANSTLGPPQSTQSQDIGKEMCKLNEKLLALERKDASLSQEIRDIRKAVPLPASSITQKVLNSAQSHATESRIQALTAQVGELASKWRSLHERQTQPASQSAAVSIPSDYEDRLKALETEKERVKGVVNVIESNGIRERIGVNQRLTDVESSLRAFRALRQDMESRLDQHVKEKTARIEVVQISEKLDQFLSRSAPVKEAPSALSTKERMLLNTLDSTPKRLNDLENTVFELVKSEGQSTTEAASADRIKEFDDRLNAGHAMINRVKDEVKQKVDGWEDGLRQARDSLLAGISKVDQSLESTKADLKASDHSLKSLTSRYNNLTSEKVARQIADIVQPLPIQLQREQASMKAAIGELEARSTKLSKSFETLSETTGNAQSSEDTLQKARALFVGLKDFLELQETILGLTNRVSAVENMPNSTVDEELSKKVTDLSSQFEKGRNDLQTTQEDLRKRLGNLEGRAAHASEWDDDDDNNDEEKTLREGSSLLSRFQGAAKSSSGRPPSRSSASSNSARGSPAVKKASQASSNESVPFAARVSHDPSQPKSTPLRTLTTPNERPQILASRIESPYASAQASIQGSRKHSISDGEDELNDPDTVVVKTPGRCESGRKRGKRTH